jgi:hypothetical protein
MAASREEIFEAWAPAESPWSAWAKPVLFTHAPLTATLQGELPSAGVLAHLRDSALILDVPGVLSVQLGLALAKAGFQPVPLYNCGTAKGALVNMEGVEELLTDGAEQLKRLKPRAGARPVFMLNSDRMDNVVNATSPGRYDNRWQLVPQDMPSAAMLLSAGIKRVAVLSARLQDDLAHVLYRYQEANLQISLSGNVDKAPSPVQVAKPSSYKSLWYRLGVYAGLRRNSAGGFGAVIPDVTTTGTSGFS